ncbi:hypothetical protein [Gloeothece verrucosa]|uniref:Uncharacterized protein n=1 Tax=Gloeothece verrucosa (strain PCC 7822) TaxID=497965 RepID=E0U874_GLOV7|nr:hypothetical protein [Gloeothece verrucosa]ADN17279.1 hypothetical protein Cyan7822_5402 [Gloeothece verrucosa PCC 7822]
MAEGESEGKKKELEKDEGQENNDEDTDLEEITTEIENLPAPIKRVVQGTLSMQRISSPFSPLQNKITESHITKILEITEKDDERAFLDTKEERKYNFWYFVFILAFLVFITVFLVNKDITLYQEILKIIIIFGGGFGSGIGFKGYLDRKKK